MDEDAVELAAMHRSPLPFFLPLPPLWAGALALACAACTSPTEGTPKPVQVTIEKTSTPAPGRQVFDEDAVQEGVVKILTEEYSVADVESAVCPALQPVKPRSTFECTVEIGGEDKKVKITVVSADGEYEVGYPTG